jgi:DNA-binding transcriptional MerR regulator
VTQSSAGSPAGSPAESTARARSRRAQLGIGEVLGALQPEFPDLSHSKVRYLEDCGLVEPDRTPSGYRKYSAADVERLRTVLVLQRDRFMPLKAIGEYFDAVDRGLDPPPIPGGMPRAPRPVVDSSGPGVEQFAAEGRETRLRRAELVASAGIDEQMLADLESYGLISASDQGFYDADDLVVATIAAELATYGIGARHLRPFRTAADRELGLVEQVVTPLRHQRGAGSAARADEVAREMSALLLRLHATIVRAGLRRA